MPDYSIIQKLCDALHVTLPELMDGKVFKGNVGHQELAAWVDGLGL